MRGSGRGAGPPPGPGWPGDRWWSVPGSPTPSGPAAWAATGRGRLRARASGPGPPFGAVRCASAVLVGVSGEDSRRPGGPRRPAPRPLLHALWPPRQDHHRTAARSAVKKILCASHCSPCWTHIAVALRARALLVDPARPTGGLLVPGRSCRDSAHGTSPVGRAGWTRTAGARPEGHGNVVPAGRTVAGAKDLLHR